VFDALSDKFDAIFTRLRGRGRLDDAAVDEVAREIRLALLEADVNVGVVRSFIARVKERAVGEDVQRSLTPAQQVVKIVHEELVTTLGGETGRLTMADRPPTVVMLAGLQGSGKTTAAAKLAVHLKEQGHHPLLVGADLQRPAAVEQLRRLGEQVGVPVFSEPGSPVEVARRARDEAARLGSTVVVLDTAGRLHVDDDLMEELEAVAEVVAPDDVLLVVDAMTGQEAVAVAEAFHDRVPIDGVVLTKVDGDARGGAALSVKEVIGRPILFAGTGEKPGDFEPFHPDRMASRILGMGDVLTLIEKAEQAYDEAEARQAEEILLKGQFTLEDFLGQMQALKRMGPLKQVMAMLPGMPKEVKDADVDDRQLARVEAIIRSMTLEERRRPDVVNGSRRKRIARGSGTSVQDVNRLLDQFKNVQKVMRQMTGGKGRRALLGGLSADLPSDLSNLSG
jgi:signal recognition particle subunit SRP54